MTGASLYIMGSGEFLKVGIAADARKRKAQMQTGNPDLVSIHIVSGAIPKRIARKIESRTHSLLAPYRRRGEWFSCGLVEAIDAMLQAVSEWRFQLNLRSTDEINGFLGFDARGSN